MRIWKEIGQMSKEARNLLRGEYPSFVFASNPKEIDFIPIFAYHRVDPMEFESHLQFLKINGYRTVTGEEYLGWLNGETGCWKGSVLLTFDDGMSSVYTYGFPLLEKYGMHGLVFLVSGYMREEPQEGEAGSRDDLWNPLLTWVEVDKMQASGCFSFGSHTCFHHPVFASDHVIDFGNPDYTSMVIDVPVEKGTEKELIENKPERFWGRPIYHHKHFMQAECLYTNDAARKACVDHIQEAGTLSFFERPSWRRELTEVATRYGDGGRVLGASETRDLIQADLEESKGEIERRIGDEVRHLCYPYGAGSELSIMLSKQAGYETNIWQTLPYENKNPAGADPFRLVRLKKDFLRRLPGKGRRRLVDVYLHKVKRRIEGNPYH